MQYKNIIFWSTYECVIVQDNFHLELLFFIDPCLTLAAAHLVRSGFHATFIRRVLTIVHHAILFLLAAVGRTRSDTCVVVAVFHLAWRLLLLAMVVDEHLLVQHLLLLLLFIVVLGQIVLTNLVLPVILEHAPARCIDHIILLAHVLLLSPVIRTCCRVLL